MVFGCKITMKGQYKLHRMQHQPPTYILVLSFPHYPFAIPGVGFVANGHGFARG